jgi:hypothetical protein
VAAVLALVAAVLALVFPSASLAQRSDLLLAALVLATALGISSSDPARLRRRARSRAGSTEAPSDREPVLGMEQRADGLLL